MNSLTKWVKTLVMTNRYVAEQTYGVISRLRARRALRVGPPYGQSGEDAWLLGWLREHKTHWAGSGFYVDIGANHPVVLSATYLLYENGWHGLTVEPIPSLWASHRMVRPRDICLNMGVGAQPEDRPFWETVPDYFSTFSLRAAQDAETRGYCRILRETRVAVATPAEILHHVPPDNTVNYLSIDTEGLDVEILSNWPWETCLPDLISCEASATNEHQTEANRILTGAGYVPVKQFEVTAFWKSPAMV